MKPASTKNFKALLKRLEHAEMPEGPGADDPLGVLVFSFLMWESTAEKAVNAFRRLTDAIVDLNDLRVTMPDEVVDLIGERYPSAGERAQRLRATLRDIYMREHTVCLERLEKLGKREVKKYLETLDGILPYVSARVMLVCYDTHAIPVDDHLRKLLVEAEIADGEADVSEVASWLSRQVKAEEGLRVHSGLQAWADEGRSRKRTTKKKPAAKTPRSASRSTSSGTRKKGTKATK